MGIYGTFKLSGEIHKAYTSFDLPYTIIDHGTLWGKVLVEE